MSKDLLYTMIGFCTSSASDEYIILNVEAVTKSLLDEEGSVIEEIVERFIDDGRGCKYTFSYGNDSYVFHAEFVESGFVMSSNYESTEELFLHRYNDRQAFFDALDNKKAFMPFLDSVDVNKSFDDIEPLVFRMSRMIYHTEELDYVPDKELKAARTLKKK